MDLLGHFTSTSHCGNSNNPHSLCPPTIAVPASSPTLTHPVASQQLQPTAAPSRGQLAHASDDAEVDNLVGDDLDDLPDGRDGADELDELDNAEFIVCDEMYGM